jgi:hypothetical protein
VATLQSSSGFPTKVLDQDLILTPDSGAVTVARQVREMAAASPETDKQRHLG